MEHVLYHIIMEHLNKNNISSTSHQSKSLMWKPTNYNRGLPS